MDLRVPWQTHGGDRAVKVRVEDGVLVAEGAVAFVKHTGKPDGAFAGDLNLMQIHLGVQIVHEAMAGVLDGWTVEAGGLRRPCSVDGGRSCLTHRRCRQESRLGRRIDLP